ncbi:CYTH domain-containing protein [Pontiella agarivorans]|uniref:CYTH domain-containing protein n=1 Tax=Pontiella agarivorans TaxID=3038953 RepID=A0ABU5N1Z9_9BACT|nr:CYTH domain-containing protein [Pontiella agarivorans]MDZ8120453.1 CYTH domain-containing protein [Pontiella agarivorans]
MAVEIERKFLVVSDAWKSSVVESSICRQGYLVTDPKKTVRVRVMGDQGFLTVKGATDGFSRMEFEYEIDLADANYMLMLCEQLVEKTRHYIEHDGLTWELDVFEGLNAGLVMAEVELESETQHFEKPVWAGEEVSEDERYFNGYLSKHPFSQWK